MVLDDDEPNEHEPDPPHEPGPEDLGLRIPNVSSTEDAESEVPKELAAAFWNLVAIFNVALLTTSLGVLFIVFQGRWMIGGGLLAVGIGAFVLGWRGYRRARKG